MLLFAELVVFQRNCLFTDSGQDFDEASDRCPAAPEPTDGGSPSGFLGREH